VGLGILTPEQLDGALKVQAAMSPPPPLGLVLMDLRLVNRADLELILDSQRKMADRQRGKGKSNREDNLFGKVAVRLGYCTPDQLAHCLEFQKSADPESAPRLGELMVHRGLIGPAQVRRVVEVQSGMAVPCPSCSTLYNTVMFMPGSTIPCYKCGAMVMVPAK
jgi:hypothetical protein